MSSTQEHSFGDVGAPAFRSHAVDLVCLGPRGRSIAVRPQASTVAHGHRLPLSAGEESAPVAQIEWFARSAEHHREDVGVAREPTRGADGQRVIMPLEPGGYGNGDADERSGGRGHRRGVGGSAEPNQIDEHVESGLLEGAVTATSRRRPSVIRPRRMERWARSAASRSGTPTRSRVSRTSRARASRSSEFEPWAAAARPVTASRSAPGSTRSRIGVRMRAIPSAVAPGIRPSVQADPRGVPWHKLRTRRRSSAPYSEIRGERLSTGCGSQPMPMPRPRTSASSALVRTSAAARPIERRRPTPGLRRCARPRQSPRRRDLRRR